MMDEMIQKISEALASGVPESELVQEYPVEAVQAAKANYSAPVPGYNEQFSVLDERAARTNTPQADQSIGADPGEELQRLNPLYSPNVQLGPGKNPSLPDSMAINPNPTRTTTAQPATPQLVGKKQQEATPDNKNGGIDIDLFSKLSQQPQGVGGIGLSAPNYNPELEEYRKALEAHRLASGENAAMQESATQMSEMATDYNKKIQEINKRENEIFKQAKEASDKAKVDYDSWLKEGEKLTGPSRKKAEDEFYGDGAIGFFTRALGAIAVSMGAYASNGGRNFAQEGIDRAIDQELEKQKTELALYESKGKRIMNGWALAKERFGSDLAAESAFRAKAWNDVLEHKNQYFKDKLFLADQKMKDAELNLYGKQKTTDLGIKIKQATFDDKYKIATLNLHKEQLAQQKNSMSPEKMKIIVGIAKDNKIGKTNEVIGKLDDLQQRFNEARKKAGPLAAWVGKIIPDKIREAAGNDALDAIDSLNQMATSVARGIAPALADTGVVNAGDEARQLEANMATFFQSKKRADAYFNNLRSQIKTHWESKKGDIDAEMQVLGLDHKFFLDKFPSLKRLDSGAKFSDKAVGNKPATKKVGK